MNFRWGQNSIKVVCEWYLVDTIFNGKVENLLTTLLSIAESWNGENASSKGNKKGNASSNGNKKNAIM